jgi:uncharacterized 2Fe-2S/4Fe-4S cluster protein (DUF4445 family)
MTNPEVLSDESAQKGLSSCFRVKTSAPSLVDNTADLDRLKKGLITRYPALKGSVQVPLACTGDVAARFRQAGFCGWAICNMLPHGAELVDFTEEQPKLLSGMALDLGTTHLEASLIDMVSGRLLARANAPNRQIEFGADILSRIQFAGQVGEEGLQRLQRAVVATINQLAQDLAAQSGIMESDIRACCVSGNTTMVHLLLGLDPAMICREPYIPLVNAPDPCRAKELGLALHEFAPVWCLPSIGSYFGGDLISGILASGLDAAEHTSMLIDVGTNAEVVLGNKDWLIACAGAAGPALEGGVARMGMRAAPGAVEKLRIDRESGDVVYNTIGGAKPVGICGSGMIDLVAALYLSRIIDLRGKFRTPGPTDSTSLHDLFTKRITKQDDTTYFMVASAEESGNGEPVLLSQIDLDAMMRSKAAMYAILTTLVNQVGIGFEELDRIYVAGAFGKHIDPKQAITLGMLPDLDLSTYIPIGNSSLQGAELILCNGEARARSMEIGNRIAYIELNVNQEFMIRFSGSRFIPHTDPSLFPSVPVF